MRKKVQIGCNVDPSIREVFDEMMARYSAKDHGRLITASPRSRGLVLSSPRPRPPGRAENQSR